MLQYLVILLDDTSTSYCLYENTKRVPRLISPDDLKAGIRFAMKQNLMIQYVYPSYDLPQSHKDLIHSMDHNTFIPAEASSREDADVLVFNKWDDFLHFPFEASQAVCVLRTDKKQWFDRYAEAIPLLPKLKRLNVVLTDVETFDAQDVEKYKDSLTILSKTLKNIYAAGHTPQLNLLTDRLSIEKMNNCNAGVENITLAPNGKFYVCPAFYFEDEADSIGDPYQGLDCKNAHLYKLAYAPICRICDAYQCKRCVWLNRKTTREVNTPSYEQCVTAHVERNASRELLAQLRMVGSFLPQKEIKEIDYLDPFEIVEK